MGGGGTWSAGGGKIGFNKVEEIAGSLTKNQLNFANKWIVEHTKGFDQGWGGGMGGTLREGGENLGKRRTYVRS